ncbi:helix-turn-helix domain-containing protein [Pseudopontixanthobacter vadosimaris]|uniref:helix-turn-helix domain-containing protein n=1 Tax=Pseudopontixanthobacter vadosimaris TaxID=2726450 RepID=UPI0014767D0F|nr:XRE family transcriptional regulator [Pseudopontixanthobacter vadosimaris]
MAQSNPLFLGPRIRRLRRELGLTQMEMAADLGVSGSYVALLERNQRPVTADMLLKLARTYRLDVTELGAEDSAAYSARVSEALRDPIFADLEVPSLEVADLATSFPSVSEAFLRLHGAYTREQRSLAEQRLAPGGTTDDDPVEATRRFLAGHDNHFPILEAKASALAETIREKGGAAEWLRGEAGVRVRFLPADVMMATVRRYDRHNEQLLIEDTQDAAGRQFQIALHIAYTSMRREIETIMRDAEVENPTALDLIRRALASYAAAALVMPYEAFVGAVDRRAYDILALSREFGTSFEQVAHRLTTLNRSEQSHVPFFFVRLDEAGNISKRLDGAGFPFATYGGGCPLWTVHTVFRTPQAIVTQWLRMPDGQEFFSIARSVRSGGGRFGDVPVSRAVALVCSAEDAAKTVYGQAALAGRAEATPVGIACRLCNREACRARAAPPLGREIMADDYRRGAAPFTFAD